MRSCVRGESKRGNVERKEKSVFFLLKKTYILYYGMTNPPIDFWEYEVFWDRMKFVRDVFSKFNRVSVNMKARVTSSSSKRQSQKLAALEHRRETTFKHFPPPPPLFHH